MAEVIKFNHEREQGAEADAMDLGLDQKRHIMIPVCKRKEKKRSMLGLTPFYVLNNYLSYTFSLFPFFFINFLKQRMKNGKRTKL